MDETQYANNIFSQPWWLDIVAAGGWREVVVKDKKNNIIARQAVVGKGNVYMPQLTQTLGIWMADDIKNDYGKSKRVILDILKQIGEVNAVQICLDVQNDYILPYRWAGYVMEPKFTYRIDDLSDLEVLYNNFNKTAKKNIKYARNKVSITYKLDIDELWTMLNKTFEVQKRKNPLDKNIVYSLVKECEKRNAGKYICAKDKDGNVHSCAYFVYDEKACFYLLGASDAKFRNSGAQSLVIWEGIQFAATVSKTFDFEGSMVEGIENFFRQFNGKCTPYYEVRKQSIIRELLLLLKPKIKRLIGYKI